MAGNFSIVFKGLALLQQDFSQKVLEKQLTTAVGTELLQVHNALRFAVHEQYAIDKSLDSVLKGKSVNSYKQGKALIGASLEYETKSLRLAEFPFTVKTLLVKNRMMLPDGTLRFASIKNKIRAKEYSVMVKRKGGYKEIYGKTGRGAFRTNKVPSNKVQLLERQQDATWKDEPFTRAHYKPLFGPSLATMANSVLETDSKIAKLIAGIEDRIATKVWV
jgi:hypothetical protein